MAGSEVPYPNGLPPQLEATKASIAQVCEIAAGEMGRLLMSDMRLITNDIRKQYNDHNQLLAKQELVVQQLADQVKHLTDQRPGPQQQDLSQQHGEWLPQPANITGRNPTGLVHFPANKLLASGSTHVPRAALRGMSPRMESAAPPLPFAHPHPTPENTGHDDMFWEIPVGQGPAGIHSTISKQIPMKQLDTDAEEGVQVKGDQPETNPSSFSVGKCETWQPTSSTDSRRPEIDHCSGNERFSTKTPNRVSLMDRQKKKTNMFVLARGSLEQQNLAEEDYNVCQFYYHHGFCQWLARSELFANITLGVIGANAIYIGIDADNNNEEALNKADIGFQVCENLFCCFFAFEWLMRFGAFKRKRDGLKDMWFKFDTALVTMMALETWIVPTFAKSGTGIPTGLLKLLRLLRLARMARLMRALPELVAMIKGVKVASKAVGSALLMLIMLVYIFAIVMHALLKDSGSDESIAHELVRDRFARLGLCMWTLLVDGTFLDGIGYVSRALIDIEAFIALVFLMAFVLASALTVMNMLIGVLCEVVSAVAAAEKEDTAIRVVKDQLLYMLKEMDEDGSGLISASEIQLVLDNANALATLSNLQVDVHCLMDQLDMMFEETEELTIHVIMDLILMLRGDRPPTMKDILSLNLFSRWKMGKQIDAQFAERDGLPLPVQSSPSLIRPLRSMDPNLSSARASNMTNTSSQVVGTSTSTVYAPNPTW